MRSVALSEWLRPWYGVGVTAFLSEHPLDMNQLSPEYSPPQQGITGQFVSPNPSTRPPLPGSPQPSAQFATRNAEASSSEALSISGKTPAANQGEARPHLSHFDQATPESGRIPFGTGDSSASASLNRPGSQSSTDFQTSQPVSLSASQAASPKVSPLPDLLPRAEWPSSFQSYFHKVSPAPVLWCYEALGDDLFGQPDQERSQCLKRLIGELRFPKGTSVFWPPSLPDVSDAALAQRVLLQVFQELFPKLVICLGSGPVLSFLSDGDAALPFTQRLVKGHMVVFLPDFSELIENPSLFTQAVLYLRAIVSQLFIM